jgi:hypothetical protein
VAESRRQHHKRPPAKAVFTFQGQPAVYVKVGGSDTLRQVLGFNNPSYGLGLQMTIPFRNSTGQANLADALVSKTRNVYQQRQVQEQIILDVRQMSCRTRKVDWRRRRTLC